MPTEPSIAEPVLIETETDQTLAAEASVTVTLPPVVLDISLSAFVELDPPTFQSIAVAIVVHLPPGLAWIQSPSITMIWYVSQHHVIVCAAASGYKVCYDNAIGVHFGTVKEAPEPEGSGAGAVPE